MGGTEEDLELRKNARCVMGDCDCTDIQRQRFNPCFKANAGEVRGKTKLHLVLID